MSTLHTCPLPASQPGLTRRHCLLAAAAGLTLSLGANVGASTVAGAALPSPLSLADELALALKKGQPLVVMVSLDGCPFCKMARENYLAPLRTQEGLPVVQIDMRSARTVKNFSGIAQTHDELIRSWRVKVAPTVLFFGPSGAEISKRMVGAYIPDFYGAYLDERLQQARLALR